MAQTKRKRQTKHRGNAAGQVEVRGRTGRKPTLDERKASPADRRSAERAARLTRPPSWKGAAQRSAIAAVLLAVLAVAVLKEPVAAAVPLGAFVFLLYVPLSFYVDQFLYRRRQAERG